jgi:hypothetical protein
MTHSPCTKVCKIKEGICTGCHRTLEQIGAWGSMTDKERQEAMRELKWPVAVVDRVGIMQRLSPYTNLPEGTKLYKHPASADVPEEWRTVMKELADDLESEIEARRSGDLDRRIERDLIVVKEARVLLDEQEQDND